MSFLILSGQRAWRSGGKERGAEEVFSPFVQDYIERRERQSQFRAWTSGDGDGSPSSWQRGAVWGGRARPIGPVDVRYQDATPDGQGGFYYVVDFGVVGGLFHQNAAGEERRLFHRSSFNCDGLDFQQAEQRFVIASGEDGRSSHLALLDRDGKWQRRLTEGDCDDARPSWDPAHPDRVLYQSSGTARRSDGFVENGPWEAMELDLAKGEITPLWSREGMDVLLPRRDRRGRLYALMRPSGGPSLSPLECARRIVLMPWYFAQAVFGFANAFTSMFARKTLWRAGGPPGTAEEPPTIRVLGKSLETRALRQNGKKGGGRRPSLAPESWQLWRRDPDGTERMIANRVSWYTLDADDTPLYTTGLAIHAVRDGATETVYEGPLVEAFVALG